MTWYLDLSRNCMVASGDDVRAIGWLGRDHPYPRGDPPPGLVELLESHVTSCWEPMMSTGFHRCDLDPCWDGDPRHDPRPTWRYLFEGDVAEHCGVPLARLGELDPVRLQRLAKAADALG